MSWLRVCDYQKKDHLVPPVFLIHMTSDLGEPGDLEDAEVCAEHLGQRIQLAVENQAVRRFEITYIGQKPESEPT